MTRSPWGEPASPREAEARNGFMVLTSADHVHNVKFPQFLVKYQQEKTQLKQEAVGGVSQRRAHWTR